MKITNVKAMVAKMFTVGLLAAAVVIAAPAKAEAQVGIGVRIGPAPYFGPVYRRPVVVAPAYGYYGPAYYGVATGIGTNISSVTTVTITSATTVAGKSKFPAGIQRWLWIHVRFLSRKTVLLKILHFAATGNLL